MLLDESVTPFCLFAGAPGNLIFSYPQDGSRWASKQFHCQSKIKNPQSKIRPMGGGLPLLKKFFVKADKL
jgi:hypothetical protein